MNPKPPDDEGDWDEPAGDDEESFQEWASDPSTSKEQLLAAIGKGGGKGDRRRPGKGNGKGSPGKGGGKGPSGKGGGKGETRQCYNCFEYGHIGKDCPLPDKRKDKKSGQPTKPTGSAKSLSEPDAEGFRAVNNGVRPRLCALTTSERPKNKFQDIAPQDGEEHVDQVRDDEIENCSCCVMRSTVEIAQLSEEAFPKIDMERTARSRKIMRKIEREMTQREKQKAKIESSVQKETDERVESAEDHQVEPPPPVHAEARRPREPRKPKSYARAMKCDRHCRCEGKQSDQDESCDEDQDDSDIPGLRTATMKRMFRIRRTTICPRSSVQDAT